MHMYVYRSVLYKKNFWMHALIPAKETNSVQGKQIPSNHVLADIENTTKMLNTQRPVKHKTEL